MNCNLQLCTYAFMTGKIVMYFGMITHVSRFMVALTISLATWVDFRGDIKNGYLTLTDENMAVSIR